MKKVSFVIFFIFVIFLVGCSIHIEVKDDSKSNNNSPKITENQHVEEEKEPESDHDILETEDAMVETQVEELSNYEGNWSTSKDTSLQDGGKALTIIVKDSNTIDFEYCVISAAPANRIAQFKVDNMKLDDNRMGAFTWEDSWYNKGKGIIALKPGKVVLKITDVERDENAIWGVTEGEVEFIEKL